MNRKYAILAALLALALTSLACGLNIQMPDDAIQIGATETEDINIAPGGDGPVDVTLKFGTGKLYIRPGAAGALIQGTASYNVPELKPSNTTSTDSVTLEQGSLEFELGGLPNFGDLENTWELGFSTRPISLELRAGAFLGEFELGGLALHDFRYIGGGSKIDLAFSTPNLVPMGEFKYTAGGLAHNLTGLANANFSLMDIECGGGDFLLDFGGQMQRDATVKIDAGFSNVRIVVPVGTPAVINIQGTLANVSAYGEWTGNDTQYTLPGEGPSLVININVAGGNLTLDN